MEKKTKKPRVFWTGEEVAEVVSQATELFHSGKHRWMDALIKANMTMPPGRQVTKAALYNKSRKLRALSDSLWEQQRAKETQTRSEMGGIEEHPTVTLEALLTGIIQRAIRKEVQDLKEGLRKDLIAALSGTPEPVAEPAKREERHRVLVVGMIGQQITEIKNRFGDRFALSFHQATENNALLAGRIENVNSVLCNVGKINHSMYSIIQRKANGKLFQFDGGVSAVARILEVIK
jgi:hypothetical protein